MAKEEIGHGDGGGHGRDRRLAGVPAEKIGLPEGLAELVGVDERRGCAWQGKARRCRAWHSMHVHRGKRGIVMAKGCTWLLCSGTRLCMGGAHTGHGGESSG